MSIPATRLPPHSPEAEASVLGAMLLHPEAVAKAMEILEPGDFYQQAHQRIFEAMTALFQATQPVDVVMVGEELRRRGELDAVGGLPYLMELAALVPTAAHVEHYAQVIRQASLRRALIATANHLIVESYEGEKAPAELLDYAQNALFQLTQRGQREVVPLHEVLIDAFHRLEQLYENRGKLVGLPTGFIDLDRLTAGLQASDLIVVAARPSMGKTMFCLNLARHVATREKVPVAIFSLEMSREQLALRLLSAEAEIEGHRLRSGELDERMWAQLSIALGRLGEAPIFIDDTPAISALELRAKARQLKSQHNIGLIIIDYMQLMQGRRSENRQQEISDISRSLKALARELNIPVVALSQLSRAVESRTDKRPMLSDLRESGAIEQDADVVAFLYREDYYSREAEQPDLTEVIVAKQRNGPTGTVRLLFKREIGKFFNTAPLSE
ncbi:MAG: replicative DNA helicase [Firmicutes bacterium]|nr:replicative DNA helicase [Alicyclobacillaceae bacterium]MCL6496141.1 replicative DNA helicase [Bacillota bacterium]